MRIEVPKTLEQRCRCSSRDDVFGSSVVDVVKDDVNADRRAWPAEAMQEVGRHSWVSDKERLILSLTQKADVKVTIREKVRLKRRQQSALLSTRWAVSVAHHRALSDGLTRVLPRKVAARSSRKVTRLLSLTKEELGIRELRRHVTRIEIAIRKDDCSGDFAGRCSSLACGNTVPAAATVAQFVPVAVRRQTPFRSHGTCVRSCRRGVDHCVGAIDLEHSSWHPFRLTAAKCIHTAVLQCGISLSMQVWHFGTKKVSAMAMHITTVCLRNLSAKWYQKARRLRHTP